MAIAGKVVLYIVMACCAAGGIAAVVKEDSGLAQAFHDGLNAFGSIFIPFLGVMVSIPFLKVGVEAVFGNMYRAIGADPAVAAAAFLPADAGGYALALDVAASPEIAMIAFVVSIMLGTNVMLNIPLGFSILEKKDRPYMALGMLSGILSIPIGILATCLLLMASSPSIRTAFTTSGASDYVLHVTFPEIAINILPVIVLCLILVLLIRLFPNGMVKAFMWIGKIMLSILTLIAVASFIQYYTGFFSFVFGGWGFDPIMADGVNNFRTAEVVVSVVMMLSGAFPMIYLIRKYFGKGLEKLGRKLGLDETGSSGLVATLASNVAMFSMIKDMPAKSKVMVLAFMPCAGYALGDWMAFNCNVQPNMVVPVLIGQLIGGCCGLIIAKHLVVSKLPKYEESFGLSEKDVKDAQ